VSDTTAGLSTTQAYLDELQAQRDAAWTRAEIVQQAAAREAVEDAAVRSRFVKVGDRLEPFALAEVDGGQVVLDALLEAGPVVLLTFRFEGCPSCNAALRGYQATLAGPLTELGATLVAISAQVVDRLGAIKRRHGLRFLIASDPHAELITSLGLGFAPDAAGRREALAKGQDLGETLGTGDWTLAYPSAIVVDRERVVRFVDVHPDWMVRTPETAILDAVRSLV
jgi:peroxiredoxin